MAAGSIIIDLLLKTGQFSSDTKRAEKALKELEKEAKAMGIAVGAAFAAVGAASVAMVKSAIDNMDEMGKMAQKVGTSVEALSALAYAADLAGVNQEQLSSAMVKLSKNMSDAAQGTGDAAKAFAALGINVTNADGSLKSSDKVLEELAGKFAGYKDGVEKTALAVAIFGKAGADMIPLLNGGADGLLKLTEEARQLGVVMSTEASKAAEEFNDNLTRMGYAVQGVANQAAKELLPALTSVSEMLLDVAKNEASVGVVTDVVKAAIGGLITVFQTVAVVGSDVSFVFLTVGRSLGAVAAAAAAVARGDFQGVGAIFNELSADSARARAELDKFQARVMSLGQAGYRDPRLLGDVSSIAAQTAGWKPPAPRAGGGGGAGRASGAGRAAAAEKPYATSDKYSEADALEMEARMLNEAQQEWAKYEAQLVKVEPVIESVALQMSEGQRMMEGFGASVSNAIEDLVIGGASAKDVFSGLLKSIAQMILQVGVLEPMMAQLRLTMGGSGGMPPNPDAAGAGGGINWGSILSSVASAFGGARAEGGPVGAGSAYLVGERGPEMFVPRTSGMVVPNSGTANTPWTIVNNGRPAEIARIEPREKMLWLQEARKMTAADIRNASSATSDALQQSLKTRRKR